MLFRCRKLQAQLVSGYLSDGWELHGTPMVAATMNESWYHYQAVTRKTPEAKEDLQNDKQQLKAKICAQMRDAVENMQDGIADGLRSMVIEWERKLSAV